MTSLPLQPWEWWNGRKHVCVCVSVLLLQFDWGVLAEVSAVCTSILCYCSELRVLVCIYTSVFGVWPPLHSLLRQELGFFLKRTSLWVYSVCVCVCYTACVSISFLWLCGTQRVITACKWVAPLPSTPPPHPSRKQQLYQTFFKPGKVFLLPQFWLQFPVLTEYFDYFRINSGWLALRYYTVHICCRTC